MATSTEQHFGVLRFGIPDDSLTAEERGLFAPKANKGIVEEKLVLHDARTDTNIVAGPDGLDVQGFAYIKHQSALTSQEWFTGDNVENVYLPELTNLMLSITGAKNAVVNNVAFRRRTADQQADPNFVLRKGEPLDQEMEKLPKDTPLVYGKDAGGSLEPARAAHIDYTARGLRSTARYCRKDITEAARAQLEAEDDNKPVPRYAAYSVWRPVATVRRDPLAVCDWRSVDKEELERQDYRALSNINANGEYMMEAWHVMPPKNPSQQRWYWMPEQKPDELLIIKFADTDAEKDSSIAGGCPHLSPIIPGTEQAEPRLSIEARVLVFW